MRALSALTSLTAAALAPVVAIWFLGCGNLGKPAVRGSGVVRTESRDVSGFTEVWLGGSGDVIVEQSGDESLTVEAEDNLLPLLETRVEDGRLTLGTKRDVSISPTRPIRFHVTVKELTGFGVAGSGDVRVSGVETRRLSGEIAGSGSAKLSGTADDVRLSISGSGSYDAAALTARTATVAISGSGSATVNAAERLEANVSGSGSVRYLGSPSVNSHVSGSGSVSRVPG